MRKKTIVENLAYETELLLNQKVRHKKATNLAEKIKTILGKWGYLTAAGTMALGMGISSVHVIKPSEYLQLHIREFGYQNQIVGERSDTIEYSDEGILLPGKLKLFFTMPAPLTLAYPIDTEKVYDVNSFLLLRESSSESFLGKIKNFWAGQMAMGYEGINFNVEFKVKDGWKTFNEDGKGNLRLEQIIGAIVQENADEKTKEFNDDIYKEEKVNSEEMKIKRIEIIKQMSAMINDQKFKDKISAMIYPSPFNRLSYGSVYERYSQGFEYLKSKLDEMEKQKTPGQDKWRLYLKDFRGFIEGEDEQIKEAIKEDVAKIRLHPLEFKRLIGDIEKNYNELFAEYPSLISNFYEYAKQEYITVQEIKSVNENKDDLVSEGLLKKLQGDKTLSQLVDIIKIKKSVKKLEGLQINNYSQRSLNLL